MVIIRTPLFTAHVDSPLEKRDLDTIGRRFFFSIGLAVLIPGRRISAPISIRHFPQTPNSRAVHALPAGGDVIGYDAGNTSPSLILRRVISPSSHPIFRDYWIFPDT